MKTILLFAVMTLLLTGCAALEEAYFVDREYGQAQMASWDKQILNTDYKYADNLPEGQFGITSEETMNVYNQMFAEKPQKVQVFQFDIGE